MLPDLENLPCRNYGSGAGLFSFYTLKYFSVIFIHNLYAFLPLAVKKKKQTKKKVTFHRDLLFWGIILCFEYLTQIPFCLFFVLLKFLVIQELRVFIDNVPLSPVCTQTEQNKADYLCSNIERL